MEKTDIIDFNELPSFVLEQIPFSIRTKQKQYILKDLPLPIQYIIEKYYNNKFPTVKYEDALDFKLEMSYYSDLGIYDKTYDLVKEYLRTYLLIRLKSYPFDPTFGCALKDQLMMLDTSVRNTYISNELYLITRVLATDLQLNINVVKFDIQRYSGTANSQYICNIELKVNDDLLSMAISSSD